VKTIARARVETCVAVAAATARLDAPPRSAAAAARETNQFSSV